MNSSHTRNSLVIGISGISGAGKTFYIHKLKEILSDQISVLSFDDYYKPLNEQNKDENGFTNFDLPGALNHPQFLNDLRDLMNQKPVEILKYNFENNHLIREKETIAPAPILIVEGIFIYEFVEINALINHRVFIETEINLCLSRRLLRDEKERGIPAERSYYQWINHVLPAYEKYILKHKVNCDFVLLNNEDSGTNLELLLNLISQKKSENNL